MLFPLRESLEDARDRSDTQAETMLEVRLWSSPHENYGRGR